MRLATSITIQIQIKQSNSLIFLHNRIFAHKLNMMGIFHSCNDIDSIITKYAKNLIDNWRNFVGSLPCDDYVSIENGVDEICFSKNQRCFD